MNEERLHELLYQAFETEVGGLEVYKRGSAARRTTS